MNSGCRSIIGIGLSRKGLYTVPFPSTASDVLVKCCNAYFTPGTGLLRVPHTESLAARRVHFMNFVGCSSGKEDKVPGELS
jgi:hypothetical protein